MMYMVFVGGIRRRLPFNFFSYALLAPLSDSSPHARGCRFLPKDIQEGWRKSRLFGYDVDPDSNYRHTTDELRSMFLAIIAAMPPHVKPYRSMGCDKTWAECDWGYLLSSLTQEAA